MLLGHPQPRAVFDGRRHTKPLARLADQAALCLLFGLICFVWLLRTLRSWFLAGLLALTMAGLLALALLWFGRRAQLLRADRAAITARKTQYLEDLFALDQADRLSAVAALPLEQWRGEALEGDAYRGRHEGRRALLMCLGHPASVPASDRDLIPLLHRGLSAGVSRMVLCCAGGFDRTAIALCRQLGQLELELVDGEALATLAEQADRLPREAKTHPPEDREDASARQTLAALASLPGKPRRWAFWGAMLMALSLFTFYGFWYRFMGLCCFGIGLWAYWAQTRREIA